VAFLVVGALAAAAITTVVILVRPSRGESEYARLRARSDRLALALTAALERLAGTPHGQRGEVRQQAIEVIDELIVVNDERMLLLKEESGIPDRRAKLARAWQEDEQLHRLRASLGTFR
jgi:hypothetical protein